MVENVKNYGNDRLPSMRQRAYLFIQKKIATRELRAGEQVSESSLSGELKISRTPIREAVRQLISDGLLREFPGHGTVVAQLTRQDLVELFEMYEVLERHAVQKVASQLVPSEEMGRLQELNDEILALRNELAWSGKAELDSEQMKRFEISASSFRFLLARIAGNSRILKAVKETDLLIRIFAERHRSHDSVTLERIHADHCEVLRAIAERDAERAVQVMAELNHRAATGRLKEYDLWERETSISPVLVR
jgi:DNA-binding GntR family transcriptional regulator